MPLGSILGPLLFNLYIDDTANIDDNVSLIIYADDTSIFFSGADTDQIIDSTHTFLEKLNAWTGSNSLQINCSETKAVLFRSRNTNCFYSSILSLGTHCINIVESVKFLRIIFN